MGSGVEQAASRAEPTSRRIAAIDCVRGFALLGVLLVNVLTEFRVSVFQQFLSPAPADRELDRQVASFVSLAIEFKAFCLFCLLFGVGLAMQLDRLTVTGRAYALLLRRLAILLVLGLAHLLLVWNGDVLTEYALVGLVAQAFLRLPSRLLIGAALAWLAWYVVQPYVLSVPAVPSAAVLAEQVELANRIYGTGSYSQIRHFSLEELRLVLPLHFGVAARTLALFLLGAGLWRSGAIRTVTRHRGACASVALACLLVGSGLMALSSAERGLLGWAASALAPVALALGYGAALLLLAQWSVLAPIASLGRTAFSNYIAQSVICGWVFFGYGLGAFGRVGALHAFGFCLALFALQAWLSQRWLARFHFGPLEWLWRSAMYGRWEPLRISAASAEHPAGDP